MNTNGLAKLYGPLTPAERLSLIIAASRRGDAVERDRLSRAAPRTDLRVPDFFARGIAYQEASVLHVVVLLDLAANFWQAWGLWGWQRGKPLKEREVRLAGSARMHAHLFEVNLEGWARFSAELQVDKEALLDYMPGADIIRRTRDHVRDLAFTPEQAAIFLRLEGQETALPPTVEDVLRTLQEVLKEREAWWDGGSG